MAAISDSEFKASVAAFREMGRAGLAQAAEEQKPIFLEMDALAVEIEGLRDSTMSFAGRQKYADRMWALMDKLGDWR